MSSQPSKYEQIERNYLQNGANRELYKQVSKEQYGVNPYAKPYSQKQYPQRQYPQRNLAEMRSLIRPQAQLKVGGSFNNGTAYTDDYPMKGAVRAERYPLPINEVMPRGNFTENSTYQNTYLGGISEKPFAIRPEGQLKVNQGNFSGGTSYQADYPGKSVDAPQRKALPFNEIIPKGRFEGNSTYDHAYVNSPGKKEEPFRPEQQLKVGGQFEGMSSYAKDYDQKPTPERREKIVGVSNDIMPKGRFEGNSTYQSNYLQSKSDKMKPFIPQQQLRVGGKFQGKSSYGNDYIGNQNQIRRQKILHPDNKIMPQGNIQQGSTYNDTYVRNENQIKRQKILHPDNKIMPQGRFRQGSTYNDAYIGNENFSRRQKILHPDNKIMPQGQFHKGSTYNDAYIGSIARRNTPIHPQGQLQVGNSRFEGSSNYAANYVNNGSYARAQKILHPDNHIMPQGRFEQSSTYNGAYLGNAAQRSQAMHPEGELRVGQGRFEGISSYEYDYENKNQKYERRQKILQNRNQVMPNGKFTGNSTYQENYIPNSADRRPSINPRSELHIKNQPFEGETTYHNNYRQFQWAKNARQQ